MNIAAYCRVSTDKADQLNSLEAQKDFFAEYTQRTGDNLVRLYADEGISGTKIKNRREFLRMMADAEHGLFDMVVVKDISRFARNTVDLLQNIRKLKALGIETQFLTANMTSMGNSEFVLTIFGALAQEESANTSKRVKFGKKLNAEKGRVPNIVYGYDKIIGDYFNLNINEFEADIVRQIYKMYITDNLGASKIAKTLNERNIKTKRGYKWSQNAICRLIANEIYTGIIVNGKQEIGDFLTNERINKPEEEWKIFERRNLAIIDRETYEKAQRIMAENATKFKADGTRKSCKNIFSTLIKCTGCGHFFRRTKRKVKNGEKISWVCCGRNSQGKDTCNNKIVIDEGELLTSIKEYLSGLISDKQRVIKKIVSDFNKSYEPMNKNRKTEKELEKEIEKLKKSRQKYIDMYDNEVISMDDLKEKTSSINAEIKHLEEKLKMARYGITQGDKLQIGLVDTFKTIGDILNSAEITNEMLKQVIDRIEVSPAGQVDIYLRLLTDIGLDKKYHFNDDRSYSCNNTETFYIEVA